LEGGKRPELTTFATFATPGRTMGHLEGGKRTQVRQPVFWDLAKSAEKSPKIGKYVYIVTFESQT
jgi:hypothetical protein